MATTPTATKIMIIRHAEKPPSDNNPAGVLLDGTQDRSALIVQGWQRAGGARCPVRPCARPAPEPGTSHAWDDHHGVDLRHQGQPAPR